MSENSTTDESTWKKRLETHASDSTTPVQRTARTVETEVDRVTDRQERIEGFDQTELENARLLLVGAGGIGGEVSEGLVRKGVGALVVCDEDIVDATNLNRQKFREDDIGTNKAVALSERLVPRGTTGTEISAHPYHFQDAMAVGADFDPNVVVCAPDNDEARLAVCDRFGGEVPIIYTGLDTEANGGYVFVQSPDGPCFRCYRPEAGGGGACPAAPSVTDPTKTVAGMALYGIDSAIMDRPREWDAMEFYLSGILPTRTVVIDSRQDCSCCE